MATLTTQLRRGTGVYSRDGQWLGRVASYCPGMGASIPEDTSADETQEMQPIPPDVLELLDRLDLPVHVREELAVSGFVKVQGRSQDSHRYFLPEQITQVEPGRVVVNEAVAV